MTDQIMKATKMKFILVQFILFSLAIVPIILSALASYLCGDGQWFQRSGALCVLFSAILEIYQSRRVNPESAGSVYIEGKPASKDAQPKKSDIRFQRLSRAGIVVGTVIWGYGDLAF